jgi:hypothetical protein
MTPDQKTALKQALDQHSFRMSIKDAAPEEIEQLPEDFQVPSYSVNTSPVYDNQLFPKITSADDLIKLGYATPEGTATENGQMAISLKRAGALNDDYTLNDTGKAMMANPADLLEEENLPLYIKAKELDLDGSGRELSWGEHYANLEKEVKEGAKNLSILLATASPTSSITGGSPYEPVVRTTKEQAALNLEAEAALGGLVKSGAQLATGVSKIAGAGAIKALADSEAEERLALSMFDQRFEKIDRDIQASRVSEVIDAMGQMAGAELGLTEARKKNIELVGKEEAAAIEKRGESAGQFAGMINPYGAAAMTGKVAFGVAGKGLGVAFRPISRSLLQADSKAALVLERTRQLASLERRTAGFQAAAQAAERQAVIAESMAEKFSKAGLTDRANNALKLANQSRGKGQEALTRVGGFTDEITKVSDDLAKATQSAGVADKVLQMGQVAKQIPYLPVVAIGKTLELTGRGMIGIDKGLSTFAAKVGADKAYNAMNRISSLSGLGGAGAALGLGPVAFIPAAARLAWSTAPYLKAAGEYVSLVGKEASKARGQIGFWKRIYEMPNKGPAHRMVSGLMDTATAGGLVTGMGSRVTKGLLSSYPVDLAYEWVSEGGDLNPNVFKQAAVETLFFGGTGAALGGITMGSANRIKQLQNGDALNFYSSISDPAQRLMYNGMPSDLKRVVGTFSASNPGAKIQFVDQGLGAYDRNTKTVMINPNAPNPLKPLLTHEFMHHMLNNGIGDGVIAQLVGDGFQTGGLLRGKDGSYDAQYSDFKEEYVGRLRKQHEREVKLRDAIGDPMTKSERDFKTPDEKYLAEEYFIETNVDDMLGLVESGKLGKMAGRMIINDKVRALGDSILNKSSILRDLHFRIGGVIDNSGKMVTGNGFLGGKLYQSPEVRRMFQKMVSESVGRRGGIDAAKRKAREGVEIPIQGKSDPILGELGSLWESDSDGSPLVDGNGDFVPLKKETDELRSQAGLLLVDDLKARQNRGETIPDGELAYNPENNTWSGQYLNDRQIELLSLSGRFNSKQIKQLKLLNEGARKTSDTNADPATRGHRFSVIYQSALKKNRKGQWKYDQIKPQLRDVVPYGVEISKDGNILIRIMSTNQLFANVSEKAASKRGRMLYDGNMETILRDANAIIDLHGKNQATDAYFKEKYGGKWETHKSFINSVFGNVGKGHKDINPLVASDRVDAVVKSYRLDRMNKATQLVGSTQLPYQNNMIKINYLPEGEPIMDANGEPKDLRNTPRYEAVSQVKMPEQVRQMPEKRVAFEQDQDKKAQTNGNQPTTIQAESSRTGTGRPETQGGGLRGQGGLPRGTEQLQPLYSPRDSGIPLEGLPATVKVPGLGRVTFGPNETSRQVAADYAKSVGIDYNPPKQYAEVDEARATSIAAEYDKMVHAPNDPKVKASYDAMIKETLAQWEAIKKTGLKVEAIPAGAPNPYEASPRLAVIDVNDNNHLWFFPTEAGFGTAETADIDISGNPLMAPTGEILNGHKMLANDVFRVVHDYFGHIKEGVGFRADGEENAWRSHSSMYSDLARPAMTSETRGQNSWVNYGPYGEHNRNAKGDTIYAPQKTGIMPDWVMQEGASDPKSNNVRFMPEGKSKAKTAPRSYRRSNKEYRDPTLAKRIAFAISGLSEETEKRNDK